MKYFEIDSDGFVDSISIGDGPGYEITEERYLVYRDSFSKCPPDTDENTYRLNTSLEWVAIPKDPEIDDAEALEIILGGAE